jgi:hypothetical protein
MKRILLGPLAATSTPALAWHPGYHSDFHRAFIITTMAGAALARCRRGRHRCTRLWVRHGSDAGVRPFR